MVSCYRPRIAIVAPSWAAVLVCAALGLVAGLTQPAMAQARVQDRGATPKAGTRAGLTPAQASASEDEKQQGSDDESGEGRSGGPRVDARESFLVWMARASGPIGVVIAVMSFYLVALVVWMALRYRTPIALPQFLVRELRDLLEQQKYSEAYHRLIADPSLLARVLAAGVRKLPSGLPHAVRAMEMANEDATMEMEHRTTYLATVGTLGPMIGLVGTVYGMIMSFRVIAQEGSTPQASQLAAGISTALFATLEGIAVSIPAIFFYSMFRNRIARLSLEVSIAAEPLLEDFAPGVRAHNPAPAQPQPPMPMPMPNGRRHGAPTSLCRQRRAGRGRGFNPLGLAAGRDGIVASYQLPVASEGTGIAWSCLLFCIYRQLATGNWQLATDNWQLATIPNEVPCRVPAARRMCSTRT